MPSIRSGPKAIAVGPDRALWFIGAPEQREEHSKIARISLDGELVVDFPVPTRISIPLGITGGPDGNIWFTDDETNTIGRLEPTAPVPAPVPTAEVWDSGWHLWIPGPRAQKLSLPVPVAVDEATLRMFREATLAEQQRLRLAQQVFLASPGTAVELKLEKGVHPRKVRITEGEYKGRVGYVEMDWLWGSTGLSE